MTSDDHRIIRASSVMALGTVISRVTGFVRSILLVATLGTAILGDAFNVGNTMPNIIYNLLIGGALAAVFVPQIVRATREQDGGNAYISAFVTAISSLLLAITVVMMFLAPVLVSIYAPTLDGRPREIALSFTLLCLPQIFFYGLYGLLGQITNAKERFGPMMWAPIANNVVAIALLSYLLIRYPNLDLSTITDNQVWILGLGTTLGIVIQALVLLPYIRATGMRLRPTLHWRGMGLRKTFNLGGWTLLSLVISQLGFLITVNLATRAGVAAQENGILYGVGYTPYANANLILLLPHSIIAISVVTALLPQLSHLAADQNHIALQRQVRKALRLIALPIVPAALFFLFFGPWISSALFLGIDAKSAHYLGLVLSAFALSAIPLAISLVGTRTLNAFENTKSQAGVNLVINLVAVLFSLLSYRYLPAEQVTIGLALSFTVSYWIGVFLTDRQLSRYLGVHILRSESPFYLRVFAVSALVTSATWFIAQAIDPARNIVALALVFLSVTALYLAITRAMKIAEVSEILRLIRRR